MKKIENLADLIDFAEEIKSKGIELPFDGSIYIPLSKDFYDKIIKDLPANIRSKINLGAGNENSIFIGGIKFILVRNSWIKEQEENFKKQFPIDEANAMMAGTSPSEKFGPINKFNPIKDGNTIYLQFSIDGEIWRNERYLDSKYFKFSFDEKSWTKKIDISKLNINVPIINKDEK